MSTASKQVVKKAKRAALGQPTDFVSQVKSLGWAATTEHKISKKGKIAISEMVQLLAHKAAGNVFLLHSSSANKRGRGARKVFTVTEAVRDAPKMLIRQDDALLATASKHAQDVANKSDPSEAGRISWNSHYGLHLNMHRVRRAFKAKYDAKMGRKAVAALTAVFDVLMIELLKHVVQYNLRAPEKFSEKDHTKIAAKHIVRAARASSFWAELLDLAYFPEHERIDNRIDREREEKQLLKASKAPLRLKAPAARRTRKSKTEHLLDESADRDQALAEFSKEVSARLRAPEERASAKKTAKKTAKKRKTEEVIVKGELVVDATAVPAPAKKARKAHSKKSTSKKTSKKRTSKKSSKKRTSKKASKA